MEAVFARRLEVVVTFGFHFRMWIALKINLSGILNGLLLVGTKLQGLNAYDTLVLLCDDLVTSLTR